MNNKVVRAGWRLVVGLLLVGLTAVACQRQSASNDATPTPGETTAAEDTNPTAAPVQIEPETASAAAFTGTFANDGIQVAYAVAPYAITGATGTAILEGEYAQITFELTGADANTNLTGLHPSAWISLAQSAKNGETINCEASVQSYLQGILTFRPDINLNSYFILVLNNDASISVLDPTVNVASMTQLYDMILLNRPGEDWALSQDGRQLFVTMPGANQAAVVDTESLKVIKSVAAGSNPVRVRLAPGDTAVWVGNDAVNPAESGVTLIDPASLEPLAFIPTGGGHHEIAFSVDGRTAYVTNRADGTLSVIDTASREKIADLPVGAEPVAVGVSTQNGLAYAADRAAGTIWVINGDAVVDQIAASPGLSRLQFSPNGRWGFVTNPVDGFVTIFDAASNQTAYRFETDGAPNQISFSDTFAYIRSENAPEIISIPLIDLGQAESLPISSLSAGQNAPGSAAFPAAANAVAATPGEDAILVANPVDRLIYYLVEGSPTPLGSFQAHGRIPRAVLPLDRSLREIEPGVYEARIRVPQPGDFQVAFFLNEPQIIHCFNFTAQENPIYAQQRASAPPQIEFLTNERHLRAGEPFRLQFRLTDPVAAAPVSDLEDVLVQASLTTGWNNRFPAQSVGDGIYEVTLTVPAPGPTYVYFSIPSLQLDYEDLPNVILNTQTEE